MFWVGLVFSEFGLGLRGVWGLGKVFWWDGQEFQHYCFGHDYGHCYRCRLTNANISTGQPHTCLTSNAVHLNSGYHAVVQDAGAEQMYMIKS